MVADPNSETNVPAGQSVLCTQDTAAAGSSSNDPSAQVLALAASAPDVPIIEKN
jgi:hypothetical protein